MNKFLTNSVIVSGLVLNSLVFAGNEDRVGSAGASQLLVNPWARSTASGSSGFGSR